MAAVAVAILGACAGKDASPPAAQPVATTSRFNQVRDSSQVAAFVTSFRATYPALAEGRSDQAIGDAVTRICLDDLPEGGRDLALRRIPDRFENNGVKPDVVMSAVILLKAEAIVCDELAPAGGAPTASPIS